MIVGVVRTGLDTIFVFVLISVLRIVYNIVRMLLFATVVANTNEYNSETHIYREKKNCSNIAAEAHRFECRT